VKSRPLLGLLQERYIDYTKDELYAFVLCGNVVVNGERNRDPRGIVPTDASIELSGGGRFVSRGGDKLARAIELWKIPVEGRCFLDAGASTGGFTDCLLQNGATVVHSVDVGYNQLDFRIRNDSRVRVHERTNIMAVTAEDLEPPPDAAVADLSFRSLSGAASQLLRLTREGWAVALAKPQFETHGEIPGFAGVLADEGLIMGVLDSLWSNLEREGVRVKAITESPIRGRKGNREFLLWLESGAEPAQPASIRHGKIEQALAESRGIA